MIVRLLSVLAVLAVVAAGITGWFWWHSPEAALAADRDTILADSQRYAVDLNTLDYRDPDFDRWRNAATGDLLDRLTRNEPADKASAVGTKTVSTARVVTAAVTNLNSHTGTSSVVAAVEVTLSLNGAAPTPKVSRVDMDLARTPGGWKVSGLEVVGT
jgi:Mce-associated membrane protein